MLHIVLITLAYIVGIGIIMGLYLGLNLSIVLFCLIVFIYAILKSKIKLNSKIFILIISISIIGMLCGHFKLQKFDSKYIQGEMETDIKIVKLNSEKEYYTVYVCKNENKDKFLIYIPKEYKVKIGDLLHVTATFEKPSIARNRGAFDYSKYLYSQNIYGTLKIKNIDDIYYKNNLGTNYIYKIQKSIENILGRCFPQDELGIILGMTIGDTSYITEETNLAFKTDGISHLLAVSGSNVNYIILFSKFIFDKILGKNLSNYVVIFFIIIFMLVSGASASVVRAAIMGIVIVLADILAKKSNVYASICISALIILIYNPLTIFDTGFILSFGGTLGIVLLYEKIKNTLQEKLKVKNKILIYIVDTLSVTLSSQIILLPMMVYYFNSISLVSILVNLLVAPISGILTILGFLVYILGLVSIKLAQNLSYSTFALIRLIINIANIFSRFKYASILVATPKLIWIIGYYLCIYKIFYKFKNKILDYILYSLIVVSILIEVVPANYLSINFVDVGQGDSTYIETKNNKTILIDGGGSENSDYDVGEKVLLPYVLDRGKKKIDLIIISHFHEDHMEGLLTIMKNLKVDKIVIGHANENTTLYKEFVSITKEKNITVEKVAAGDSIKIDDVEFEVLYPNREQNNQQNENNNSLVLKLKYHDMSMLFTGDIEKEAEEKINSNVEANILKVAHHGSKTSSTDVFIGKVKPQIALIGVGENNKFGHPNEEVLKRLEENSDIIFRTDICGEIIMKVYKNKVKIRTLISK